MSAARFGGSAGGDRPLTIAGIGLELLGYAHVAEMLHRVAMAQRAADGSTPPFERGAA